MRPEALPTLNDGACGLKLDTGAEGVTYMSLAPVSDIAVSEMAMLGGGWSTTRWLLLPLHHLCGFLDCYGVIEYFWCFNGRFTYYLNHLAPLCAGP